VAVRRKRGLTSIPFALLALGSCAESGERLEWDANDPARPTMAAISPPDAPETEAAARACGLQNLQSVTRSGLVWIIMRDVPARDADAREPVACFRRWAMAHPEIEVFFFGRPQPGSR
jgi:hypothetical protein